MNISEIFGSMVFTKNTMRAMLPKTTYKALTDIIDKGEFLSDDIAHQVATAMKIWAMEKGATHYTHWFQPMTGITAEKHESFVSLTENGVIMEFSGKELIKGEPDASSFPSGGLRATFEARGYTAWDPTSYAFIKDNVLCIPTAFCSYCGESLDKKTPLLRSMDALNKQALRILKLFNTPAQKVTAVVGIEQEFFLISKEAFHSRPDLVNCGRTLFGAKPPKGQEIQDHYYGSLNAGVSAYMQELDTELCKLGILAKTRHKEAAPSQHELAGIHTTVNISTDQNQLTMEMMKAIAKKHGMECVLHEKPFTRVNGSGKHNNWSLATDRGLNLLDPKGNISDKRFLLFLLAVIKAVDENAPLLRLTVATAGNDHRLGGYEAPPAIVSIFLGDELLSILESLEEGILPQRPKVPMEIGVLPGFNQDTTDRNRTSPLAFTGNKFEFRMVGSALSVAGPNFVLNTIVAQSLMEFADFLENQKDFEQALFTLLKETFNNHKRIIFNGNNYDDNWLKLAKERGLPNLQTAPDALPHLILPETIELFERHGIFKKGELLPRYEILLEDYIKKNQIELLTFISMTERDILPAVLAYEKELIESIILKNQLNLIPWESSILQEINALGIDLTKKLEELKRSKNFSENPEQKLDIALHCKDIVLPKMAEMRDIIDKLEGLVAKKHWPYLTYQELMYSLSM